MIYFRQEYKNSTMAPPAQQWVRPIKIIIEFAKNSVWNDREQAGVEWTLVETPVRVRLAEILKSKR